MTDEPRHDYQATPGYAQEGGAEVAHTGEPWGGHPEAGEEPGHPDATAAHPAPVTGPRMWPRIVGVLLLFVIVGGVWIWQNPGFVQSRMGWLLPGSTGRDSTATEINTLDARVARLEQGLPSGLATLTQRLDALEARLPESGQPTSAPASARSPATAGPDGRNRGSVGVRGGAARRRTAESGNVARNVGAERRRRGSSVACGAVGGSGTTAGPANCRCCQGRHAAKVRSMRYRRTIRPT